MTVINSIVKSNVLITPYTLTFGFEAPGTTFSPSPPHFLPTASRFLRVARLVSLEIYREYNVVHITGLYMLLHTIVASNEIY